MKKTVIFLLSVVISTGLYAATISDVSKSDPAYKAIEKAIDAGYLALLQNNTFKSNSPITRKELALTINKLVQEMDGSGLTLSKADTQELSQLSKTFKSVMKAQLITQKESQDDLIKLKDEIKVLHYDLSQAKSQSQQGHLQNEVDHLKDELHAQKMYTWIALGAAALGILL